MNDVCANVQDDLVVLARGELMEAQRRQSLEEHLTACASCRQSYDEQKWLSGAMAELQTTVDLPPAGLETQLRTEFEAVRSRRTQWRSAIRVAAACVALCVAAYFSDRAWHKPASGATEITAHTRAEPDDFVPIPFAPPLGNHEHVDVYRVRLPRHELASFGVRTNPSHPGAVLTADIVVGEDGVARGIRIFP